MSTQQILGVVGGVVGAFFGYPQLGFVVGSLVGGLLTPGEKTEGPRVDDLKVQVSTYGAGIPILYGNERIGGNVVWSTNKIEIETTTGGKGGGPESTTYRYYVHMGIVLCETPRDGSTVSIVQIFQDGKLIYDARSGAPVGSALASSENPHAYFVLYQGHADQLPDPGEEAWMGGPGSVPAYRGVVRIRMNAVECPGGRVPQFSFVIATNANHDPAIDYGEDGLLPEGGHMSMSMAVLADPSVLFREQSIDMGGVVENKVIQTYSMGADFATLTGTFKTDIAANHKAILGVADIDVLCVRVIDPADNTDTEVNRAYFPDGSYKEFVPGFISAGQTTSRFAKFENYFLLTGDVNQGNTDVGLFDWDVGARRFWLPNAQATSVALTDEYCWLFKVNTVEVRSLTTFAVVASATLPGQMVAVGTFLNFEQRAGNQLICLANNLASWAVLQIGLSGGAVSFAILQESAGTITNAANALGTSIAYRPGIVAGTAKGGTGEEGNSETRQFVVRLDPITTTDFPVRDIIKDQCRRAGLSPAQYDAEGILDTLHGYKLQNPASARANIDPLLTAFAAYMVDEDGVIKFKKYEDIVSEATIVYDELGQAEDGAEPADAMPLNRAQEIDLPRSVSVSYIEPTFDYQTASEKEVRQITEATEDLIVELPIATNADHAKQVASMILFAKWRAQNTRSFKTSRKFAFLSPGDGVTVEYPRGTFRLWRITSMTDTGALCEFNVEPGDAELYTQTAFGATGYAQQEVSPIEPPTRLQLLDIPILRDVDNNAGIYAALDGVGPGWSGAELFSGDDDANLASRGTVSSDAPIGVAETALGSASSAFVDETNLITVSIGDDTFETSTRDVLLAGGAEYWALGAPGRWEIGASAQGDDLGDGRYILSRHLRGQFGTEQYVGLHEVGDTFVLLRIAGMLRPNMGVGDLGQDKRYRAVSKGRSFNSASSQTYANTGEGLMPLSPVNLRRTDTNGLTVDRRSRLAMNNSTGTLPLGETTEAYSWSFYTSGAFTTLIGTALTTTAAITSTQITTAGATPSGTLYVEVRQLSDSVGAGHELQATV